jgi:hypothetical protein
MRKPFAHRPVYLIRDSPYRIYRAAASGRLQRPRLGELRRLPGPRAGAGRGGEPATKCITRTAHSAALIVRVMGCDGGHLDQPRASLSLSAGGRGIRAIEYPIVTSIRLSLRSQCLELATELSYGHPSVSVSTNVSGAGIFIRVGQKRKVAMGWPCF